MNNLTRSIWYASPALVILVLGLGILFFADELDYVSDPPENVTIASQNDRPVQMRTVLPQDAILSIDTPRFASAGRADYAMDEMVIGIEYEGQARAYSIPHLSKHTIVNDDIRGLKIAVTWCPLCYTATVFEREVGDQVLEFGDSGKLIMNSLVMVDRATNSYWSQMLGEAIDGPMTGTRLTVYPNQWQTTWGEWLERFPDSVALSKVDSVAGSMDTYADYYSNSDTGIFPQENDDGRLGDKDVVIGMEHNGDAVAYDFETLAEQPVVNDVLGDRPIVVIFLPDGDAGTGIVFDRTLDGQTLNFSMVDGVLTDAETDSTWDVWLGTATSGSMEGQQLRRLPSTRTFWFSWSDFFPGTRVYGQG